mgnify:CR=1 FL=1
MGRFDFLRQKKFYINLAAAILLVFVLLWIAFRFIDRFTRHDKTFLMPQVIGMSADEAKDRYGNDLHFIVTDSVYQKNSEPGSIVQQDPLPDSKIKSGRNVYCIIVAKTPEKTTMPNLNNLSLRQAVVSLETAGLKVKEIVYVKHFARNAVREQLYNGSVIQPGTELVKDSKITLRVGLGPDDKSVQLPNILGVRAEDVQRTLNIAGLNLGNENFLDNDSIKNMVVVKMYPHYHSQTAKPGAFVDVWYRSAKNVGDKKSDMDKLFQEDLNDFNEENGGDDGLFDDILEETNTDTDETRNEDVF